MHLVNFISTLPAASNEEAEDARQLLRALAAQVRPAHAATRFWRETAWKRSYTPILFSLRNRNNVNSLTARSNKVFAELVLRGPSGRFLPSPWLLGTFCHELAHIKHMNHGPGFQALWKQLRAEVRALQDKGYYGDGFWSSGSRLLDSADVSGDGIAAEDLPDAAGRKSQTRPKRRKQRVPRREPAASNKTGRQTDKRRNAGGRVTSKSAFVGQGNTLSDSKGKGTGFGKQAGSKRAREERAEASEKRLRLLSGAQASTSHLEPEDYSEDESNGLLPETDAERRKLLSSDDTSSIADRGTWKDFETAFLFSAASSSSVVDLSDGISTASVPLGNMVQAEIALRKKEVLGLAPVKGGSRVLGGRGFQQAPADPDWSCKICTLVNKGRFLACDACGTERPSTS
ncbi:WLM domain-containing protein [Mycena amicta]|nr:WLM domain-containing protein [Mycena amicta]